jgi:hypothetical protein
VFEWIIGEGVIERHDRATRVSKEILDPFVE